MVLESILSPLQVEKRPWEMFFIGALYCSAAIFLAYWIFGDKSSFIMVFFTVIASIPIIYNTLKYEESKDLKISNDKKLQFEHLRAVLIFSFYFGGVALASVLWYLVLPAQMVESLFVQQLSTIVDINNQVSGNITGFAASSSILFKIFFNNLKVLIFCILFAFIYGAGAIFILTWNASVIAAAIGQWIKSHIPILGPMVAIPVGLSKYLLHGIPEVIAYFYGGIAGGIISVAIIKNHFSTNKADVLLMDIGELILIGIGFLVVAAILEVYVSPVLF